MRETQQAKRNRITVLHDAIAEIIFRKEASEILITPDTGCAKVLMIVNDMLMLSERDWSDIVYYVTKSLPPDLNEHKGEIMTFYGIPVRKFSIPN